jgi:hypothetical protein
MSIGAGVEAGSMLVPEVAWRSSASMRVFVEPIVSVFIGAAAAWSGVGAEPKFMPGMSGCWA